jgi:hypothetical protein
MRLDTLALLTLLFSRCCSEDWREEEKENENENEEEGNAGSYRRSSEQSANTTKTAVVLGRRNEKPQPIGAAGAKFVTSRPVRENPEEYSRTPNSGRMPSGSQ